MENDKIKKVLAEMKKYYFKALEDENYFPESTIKAVLEKL